jgi:uncharacterized integral membrane protein
VTDPVETGDAATERARRRLRAEKGFYIHLAVYALVNAVLFLINSRTGSPWWFFWPAFGWGLGLAIHGVTVFGMHGAARDWEERRLRELIDEERGRR